MPVVRVPSRLSDFLAMKRLRFDFTHSERTRVDQSPHRFGEGWLGYLRRLIGPPSKAGTGVIEEPGRSRKIGRITLTFSKLSTRATIGVLIIVAAFALFFASYLHSLWSPSALWLLAFIKWCLIVISCVAGVCSYVVDLNNPTLQSSRTSKLLNLTYWALAVIIAVVLEPMPHISSRDFARLRAFNAQNNDFIPPHLQSIAKAAELSESEPLKLAQGKLALRDFKEAIGLLDKGLAELKNTSQLVADTHFYKARALWGLRRFDEALSELNLSLAITPAFAPALSLKCSVLRNLNELDEALRSCERATQVDPKNYRAWHNMANVLIDLKRFERAIAAEEIGLHLNPQIAQLWNTKAVALHSLGRDSEALVAVTESLHIAPTYTDALLNKGTILKRLGHLDQAEEIYRGLTKANPGDPEAWNNLGDALETRGQLQDAADAYNVALEIRPDYEDALYNRGAVLNKLRRYKESESPLREAMRLKPEDIDAADELALALSKTGRKTEALSIVEHVIRSRPNDAQALKLRHQFRSGINGIARLSVESSSSRVTHSTTPSCV